MISKFQFIKSLEWCTELPSEDCSRESPVFIANGNEWFFRLFLLNNSLGWYYSLNLEFKCTHTKFKPCRGKVQPVGVEQTLDLGYGIFDISEPTTEEVLCIFKKDLRTSKWIKMIISFDDTAESLLKIYQEVDDKIVQTPLYMDTSFLLEGVSKDLSTLFDNGPNHDVEFICGDQAFKAHKNILSCRSEVFSSMFRTEMIEGKTGRVKIQDIEDTIFKQFLRYLYTGVLPELTVDTALQIYETADKYNVSSLKKQCASFLVEHLSPENACEILIVSDRHSDPEFKKNVMEYVIQENVPFRGETLTKFCEINSKVAAEVLNLLCQELPKKNKKSQNDGLNISPKNVVWRMCIVM